MPRSGERVPPVDADVVKVALRVWHLVTPLVLAVFVLGSAFAYMLGRDSTKARTRTVVHIVSVPGLKDAVRADADSTAESNVRSAIPAAESWYQDSANNPNHLTYKGLSQANLAMEAPGISPNVRAVVLRSGQAYCLQDQEQDADPYYYIGGDLRNIPGYEIAVIAQGSCPTSTG